MPYSSLTTGAQRACLVAGLLLAGSGAVSAATLNFGFGTAGQPTTSGFSVESVSAFPGTSIPAGAINGSGDIVGEFGADSLLLDIDGLNVDVLVSDGSGVPYFDEDFQNHVGGLGNCLEVNLTSSAQCNPSSDDNLTIDSGEQIRMDFLNDAGAPVSVSFGEFIFRDDQHRLIVDGAVEVTHDDGATLIDVANGIGDLSVIGASTFLLFEGEDPSSSEQNYYITAANVVPVPAAVWLFGSALGLLGWLRRRV